MELEHLKWIDEQQEAMTELLIKWAQINSGTYNVPGVQRMGMEVAKEFAALGGEQKMVEVPEAEGVDSKGKMVKWPLGKVIVQKKADAGEGAVRVLLGIHYDTVYPADSAFQDVERVDAQTLRGPGVADAKGGLVVMLTALKALEKSPSASQVAWEILLNPDEEIGSPGSVGFLKDAAGRNQVGLVYEPAWSDGWLVAGRKGSGNFTVLFHGRAAHAGRAFQDGRNAINAAAEFIHRIEARWDLGKDVTINCGKIEGGEALNVVPELAIARFNVRVGNSEEQKRVEAMFADVAREVGKRDGIRVEIQGAFAAPPKVVDEKTLRLLECAKECGEELGLELGWRNSGGVSDGNKLAAAGLPVIDSMGPIGGNLHSDQEFVLLPSLVERAKLTALILTKLADTVDVWS